MVDRVALEDLFAPLGPVVVKRMFGGYGVYADGLMFAISAGSGEVYLKTDEETAPRFAAEGLKPFAFAGARGTMVTSYRLLPPAAFDDEDVLRDWGAQAIAVAQRKAQTKSKGGKVKAGAARKPGAALSPVKKSARRAKSVRRSS